ncbi:GDSL-type esterase/lipase family protein [Paraclostridium bifermentans]|uniref:GDSL-type esterase/lipase family protein n=1 Tax=Paraclostridium bifermentans TaxID=1490 RepID=UPI00359CA10F
MRKISGIKVLRLISICAVILGLIILARYIYKSHYEKSYISTDKGIAKIKELENESITKIREDIEQNGQDNEKVNNEQNEDIDFNKVFEDSVIMGDSRGEGLTEYGVLSSSSVVAYKGRTVIKAKDDISTVVGLAPSKVFMTYGMNDLELFKNSNDFIKKYKELIVDVKKKLPATKIYVTSIIPTNQKAVNSHPEFKNVDKFNEAIKGMCKELNVEFIDVSGAMNSNDLYAPDGIHFKPDFYEGYLKIIKDKANL